MIQDLVKGMTVISINGLEKEEDEIDLCVKGGSLKFHHHQECCEDVRLVDFENDIKSFPCTIAELDIVENEPSWDEERMEESRWTFYKLKTDQGDLWMRWLGESNGYYGIRVNMTLEIRE